MSFGSPASDVAAAEESRPAGDTRVGRERSASSALRGMPLGATLRVLAAQTKANFTWYFLRDSEMIFWSLAIPVFFLFVFSFALGGAGTRGTATFLVPGLIGAQVLRSGFGGVGAMLATFREKKLLRRIYLTPLPAWVFFTSLVLYRMTLLAMQALLLAIVGGFVFGVHVVGNPLAIAAILLLGAATFVSLGTVIGAVVRSTESANNIASVLTVPLSFLSDGYIPIDRFRIPSPRSYGCCRRRSSSTPSAASPCTAIRSRSMRAGSPCSSCGPLAEPA